MYYFLHEEQKDTFYRIDDKLQVVLKELSTVDDEKKLEEFERVYEATLASIDAQFLKIVEVGGVNYVFDGAWILGDVRELAGITEFIQALTDLSYTVSVNRQIVGIEVSKKRQFENSLKRNSAVALIKFMQDKGVLDSTYSKSKFAELISPLIGFSAEQVRQELSKPVNELTQVEKQEIGAFGEKIIAEFKHT